MNMVIPAVVGLAPLSNHPSTRLASPLKSSPFSDDRTLIALLTPLLERFGAQFPIPTMVRAVLERSFHPQQIYRWLETVTQGQ